MTPYDDPVNKPERPREPERPAPDRGDRTDDATRGGPGRETSDSNTGRRRTPKPHEDGVPTD
jgi:hypothetical protein